MDEYRHHFKRTLAMSLALLLAVCLLLVDRWYVDRANLLKEVEVHASVIGANAVAAVTFDDQIAAEEIVDTAARVPGMLEAALYSGDGRRIAHYLRSDELAHLGEQADNLGNECTWVDIKVIAPVIMNRNAVGSIGLRVEMLSVYLAVTRFLGGLLVVVTIALLFAHLASRNIRRQIAEAEAALRHMALIDRVTGLNNRYAFERELERIVALHRRDGQGSALLFIDLDGFKKVNDLYGHQNGDRVLAEVAERLRQTLRRGDVMARIGGDEFGVILANTQGPDDVARVARALIKIASYPFMLDTVAVHTGFSIGIAMIPDDGDTAERLLNHADLAMYQAKQAGKGCYEFFSAKLGEAVSLRNQIEAALRYAVSRGEIDVVYQPQIECHTGRITGLEALVRWHRPERGIVLPGEFIAVAEESGLIIDIGRAVFVHVCEDIRDLRAKGIAVPPVAVNISARQFRQADFCTMIETLVRDNGLSAADIELELTESVLMDRKDPQRHLLEHLAELGFRITIDDFGTGYSSLSYLRYLKVDKLKIDMSFIHALPDDLDSMAITTGIIDMGHAMGLLVVAEGVESQAQHQILCAAGCDFIQGYLSGYPMSIEDIAALLVSRTAQ